MKISLTQHIIKRAKKRFKFNKNALLRTVEKAIKSGKIEKESDKRISIQYGHFFLIIEIKKDTYVPITIIDSNGMAKHEESITENIYLNGKKTKHKFIKRWENKNDKN